MNKEHNSIDKFVKAFSECAVPQGPSDELVRQTLEQIEQQKNKANPFMERIFKMKPLIKIAAAAIIIIGISAVFLFPTSGESIALAAVYTKVQQAQAYIYKMSMTMTGMGEMMGQPDMQGTMEMDVTITVSEDYGMKMENHMIAPGPGGKTQNITQLAYLLTEEKVMVSIVPERKIYQTIEFTEDLLEQTKKQNNDPREMIKQMLECEYTEMEQTEINGIKVQGFRTTDPALSGGVSDDCTVTLWVDVDTWLPVQYEMSIKVGNNGQMHAVIGDFQWDILVDAKDFEYVIPEDYNEFGSMKMPETNKESAIIGLETYKNFFGTYPEKLDLVSLMTSLHKLKDQETEFAREFREKMETAGDDQAKTQEFMQEFMTPFQSLGMFYMALLQEKKDPAYYGNQVTPDNVEAVLLRWKADNGKYTVIFGDLSSVEMDYEDLIKIEPQIEETAP